jgi:hypothetical protein
MAKETASQQRKVKKVMEEFKAGKLKGGKGKHPKVKSRKQAIAIALSEAKVPPRKGDTRAKAKKKTTASKSSPRKTTRTKLSRSQAASKAGKASARARSGRKTTAKKATTRRPAARRRAGAKKTAKRR